MTALAVSAPEDFPVYLRVLTSPKEEHQKYEGREERANDNLTLVFDTETTTDFRQVLRFGVARVLYRGTVTRTVLFYQNVSETEQQTIRAYALGRGFEAMSREEFVGKVFFPLALDKRAVVVGFNLPFDLSRLSVDFSPKERGLDEADAWTLYLVPQSNPKSAYIPRIRVQHIDSRKAFIGFTGTKGKFRKWRGAFVDLRTFAAALTGTGHSLKSAGEAFNCSQKKSSADYQGPVTPSYLDYCLNDVDLTAELYAKCLDRYAEFHLPDHPSRVYSAASLVKAAFRARGVIPPNVVNLKLLGRIMAAFYAGKVECRVVDREVRDVGVIDFTSQYPSLYCLLDAEQFLTAERIEERDSTEEVRAFLDSLSVDDLLRRETWGDPLMWTLCEVEARSDLLPLRSSYSQAAAEPTIGWNRVTTENDLTLPYLLPDVIGSKLATGRTPKFVRAVSFTPRGKQALMPIQILGAEVLPSDNLIQRLSEARIREKRNKRRGWESRALGLKQTINSGSYGVFVEVNVKDSVEEMTIAGLDSADTFESDDSKVEEPGALFCPLIGAIITSGAHLLLALLDSVTASIGGEVIYCDTDSAFIAPSKIASAVATRFDSLNPYSEPCPFLKDETPEHAALVSFFGLSSKRYCLFERTKLGAIQVLKASDHGLGMYQVNEDRENFTKRVWEDVVLAEELEEQAGEGWNYLPATAQFALTTPALWNRVSKIEGMKPFTFLTIQYLNSEDLPKGTDSFRLIPFVSPKEPRWVELANEPGARTWMDILWAFTLHRDRKYLVDPKTGRIVRRSVIVRKKALVGLGKEGGHYAARILLGKAAGAAPGLFVDWKGRLDEMGRAEAAKLGLSWEAVKRAKRTLRRRGTLTNGHGGKFLDQLKRALIAVGATEQNPPPTMAASCAPGSCV
jgi:hypothetical protein